jgi:hypothetical protein
MLENDLLSDPLGRLDQKLWDGMSMGMKFLSKSGDMHGEYVFLYEAPVQHIGDACAQLVRQSKNSREFFDTTTNFNIKYEIKY